MYVLSSTIVNRDPNVVVSTAKSEKTPGLLVIQYFGEG